MKTVISRTDGSIFGKWWWTVDRWLLAAVLLLCAFGVVLSFSATPAIAERLNYDTYFFIKRHVFFLGLSLIVMFGISFQSPRTVRRLALLLLAGTIVLMLLVPFFGTHIKGARRWIYLFGISIQPSEFAKPAFAVVSAWLLSFGKTGGGIKIKIAAIALFAFLLTLLINQPDIGMSATLSAIFGVQLFLNGLPLIWFVPLGFIGTGAAITMYYTMPHFRVRIDKHLYPEAGDTFQVRTAMDALKSGGFLGKGPAEGTVKKILPDAHTDFIIAVAGEEFGIIFCLIIVFLFAFIIVRGYLPVLKDKNLFVLLAVSGLLTQFGVQAFVNIASTLSLIPTKGMTLPFISYGGSSLLSLGIAAGMLLSLTRSSQRND